MATKNTLTMGYVLKQVKNVKSPVKDRWFAHVDRQGTLSTRGLAQHMIEHGLVGNRAEVESILTKLSECIPELVGQGYGVKLDGIGIFYPSIANKKGGALLPGGGWQEGPEDSSGRRRRAPALSLTHNLSPSLPQGEGGKG